MRVPAALVSVLFTLTPGLANVSSQQNDQALSANEERQVREFARRVAANLEKTRDLTPYLDKQPARDFLYQAAGDLEDAGLVDKDVTRKLGDDEMRRFCLAMWNIAYLSETYIYSRFLLQTGVRDLSLEKQYPTHVVKFMQRNPTIKKFRGDDSWDSEERVSSVTQFHALVNTFEQAAVLMRAYFRKHPPERSATYKQNLKYLRPLLKQIRVDTCESGHDCAGLPLGSQTITVNLPVLQLLLLRQNGRLQVLLIGLHDD